MDAGAALLAQWTEPSDIFSLLLLLGGDFIQRAIAQNTTSYGCPVVFSFGYVTYAVSSLAAVFGEGRLMPQPDYAAILISAKSGHEVVNKAWTVGRLLRDHEGRLNRRLHDTDATRHHEALRIVVYQPKGHPSPRAELDFIWWSAFLVIIVQLAIASMPWIMHGNWSVFFTVAVGTVLALLQAMNPQWLREKRVLSNTGGWTVSITRGNGARHVLVVLGKDHIEDLETQLDLAILAGQSERFFSTSLSKCFTAIMTLLWVCFLITATAIKDDTWFLIIPCFIGMTHNIFVSSAARDSRCLGIHLQQVTTFTGVKVGHVLRQAEARYSTLGSSLLPIFFPGGFRAPFEDKDFWNEAALRRGHGRAEDINVNFV